VLQAPPSRYKIIERDRRLVTIDTLTGDEMGIAPVAQSGARVDTATMRSTSSNMGGPTRGESAMGETRTTLQANLPARPQPGPNRAAGQPRGALTTIAGLFPGAEIGADDRVTLTTKAQYDNQAPRTLRLTAQKTESLGGFLLTIGALLLLGLFVAIAIDFFFVFIFLVIVGSKAGQPISSVVMNYIINDAEEVA
jgi:hypothetical protein